jgi:hypothetical protein
MSQPINIWVPATGDAVLGDLTIARAPDRIDGPFVFQGHGDSHRLHGVWIPILDVVQHGDEARHRDGRFAIRSMTGVPHTVHFDGDQPPVERRTVGQYPPGFIEYSLSHAGRGNWLDFVRSQIWPYRLHQARLPEGVTEKPGLVTVLEAPWLYEKWVAFHRPYNDGEPYRLPVATGGLGFLIVEDGVAAIAHPKFGAVIVPPGLYRLIPKEGPGDRMRGPAPAWRAKGARIRPGGTSTRFGVDSIPGLQQQADDWRARLLATPQVATQDIVAAVHDYFDNFNVPRPARVLVVSSSPTALIYAAASKTAALRRAQPDKAGVKPQPKRRGRRAVLSATDFFGWTRTDLLPTPASFESAKLYNSAHRDSHLIEFGPILRQVCDQLEDLQISCFDRIIEATCDDVGGPDASRLLDAACKELAGHLARSEVDDLRHAFEWLKSISWVGFSADRDRADLATDCLFSSLDGYKVASTIAPRCVFGGNALQFWSLEELAQIDALDRLLSACQFVVLIDDTVVACRRPVRLRLDGYERLHSDDGPAVLYTDGYAIGARHGVPNNAQSKW